jgi:hypothetical protein
MLKAKVEVIGRSSLDLNGIDKVTKKELSHGIKAYLDSVVTNRIISSRIIGKFADAFAIVEYEDKRVTDVVINSKIYMLFRKHCRGDGFDASTSKKELHAGLFGMMWGARLWANATANVNDICCYPEKSKKLSKDFPLIAKAKTTLKLKD